MRLHDLLAKFQFFADRFLSPDHWDYVVPIESKGALLLAKVLEQRLRPHAQILHARAFDFIEPASLRSKRIAVVDDTVCTGKTLNQVADSILGAGASQVGKFAFLLHGGPTFKEHYRPDGIEVCHTVAEEDYETLADDLSELFGEARPSYPDHLRFRLHFETPIPPSRLVNICYEGGIVSQYRGDSRNVVLSVHWPRWSTPLPRCSSFTGLDKLRIRIHSSGAYLDLSPIVFPLLNVEEHRKDRDSSWQSFFEVLNRTWHSRRQYICNDYESLTLSLRTKLVRNFGENLRRRGLRISRIESLNAQLAEYFGPDIAQRVEGLCKDLVSQRVDDSLPPRVIEEANDACSLLDIPAIANDAVVRLREEYLAENESRVDKYEWQSVGRSVDELAEMTGHPQILVALAVERLNDYGYLSPLPFDRRGTDDRLVLRSYRVTETATARLKVQRT